MNLRNLLIAGGLILSLVIAVFLLLPPDPGPLVGAGAGDPETNIGTGNVSQGNKQAVGSSGSDTATSSGSSMGRFEEDGDGDEFSSISGKRFRDEGSTSRGGDNNNDEFPEIDRPDASRENGSEITRGRNQRSNRDSRRGRDSGRSSSGRDSGSVPEGMIRVRGEVVVENTPALGPTLSGQLQIGVSQDSRSISVNNGRFLVNIPKEASIRFFSAVLEGKPARVISPTSAINGVSAGQVRVVVRYDALAMLHVLSAETGEPLTDVEVVRAKDYTRSSLPHPGWALQSDPKINAEESPVALDGRIGLIGAAVAIHARAAGHEWRRLTVDLIDGGERELTLERSGSVNLHLVGDSDREGVVLRLRETGMGGSPHFEVPVTSGITQMIEGILPGSWTITLEKGHWAHQPEIYDEIDFNILIDDLLELELEIPIDDEERVEASGSVFIPDGWFINNFSVRIRPTGPGSDPVNDTIEVHSSVMESDFGGGGALWYWGPVLVKPGTYGVLVLPIGYGDLFEIGEEGNSEINIELPAPVEISVQTMLADGSGVATPNLIRWAPLQPPGVPGAGAVPIGPGDNGFFVFQVPLGAVMLSCSDVAYRPKHQTEQVESGGDNAFTMLLEPAMGMLLFLDNQGTSVPWDLTWHPSADAQGHNGAVVTRGRTGVGYRLLVSQPGAYELTFPVMSGFQQVAPFTVNVPAGLVVDTLIEIEAE